MAHVVVVGVDGSEASRAAAEWAAREAGRSGRPLRMIHAGAAEVFDPDLTKPVDAVQQLPEPVLALWDRLARELPELEIGCGHVPGHPAYALAAAGGREGLVVVGSRGTGGFAGLLVGSIALRTAVRAHCPVVLVRAGADGTEQGDVVVGLDSERSYGDVLSFAFEQAAERGAAVRVLESRPRSAGPYLTDAPVDQPEIREALAAAELTRLQDAVAPWREKYPEVRVGAEVTAWPAGRVLVEASRGASLTVVGRCTSGLHGAAPWLGGVTHAVLHHAHSPVAVVPHA